MSNWYENKGLSLKVVCDFCRNELGLKPSNWANMQAALKILEVIKLRY